MRAKNIEKNLKKGTNKTKIIDAQNATETDIRNAYKELLGKQITDETLIEILTQEENIQKIGHRIEIETEIINTHGNTMLTLIAKIGKKSIRETIKDINKYYKKGQTFKDLYDISKTLDKIGYSVKEGETKDGNLSHINITATLRKA